MRGTWTRWNVVAFAVAAGALVAGCEATEPAPAEVPLQLGTPVVQRLVNGETVYPNAMVH